MANTKWTQEKIIEFVNNDDNCTFVDFVKINGVKSRIIFYCKKHNIEHEIIFDNFKSGQRCKKCSEENKRKGLTKWTKERIENYVNIHSNYRLLNIQLFNGLHSIIQLECDNGHKYLQNFSDFHNSKRCPHCAKNAKLSIDIIKERMMNEDYTLLSTEYINAQEDLIVMCNHNHIYQTNWNRFQNGKRCPYCYNENKMSKGMKKIIDYLNCHNIDFILEYRIDDCRSTYPLPFDIYLTQQDILIEFDGQQHFMALEHWGGIDGLIERKIHDTMKNYYCQQNNLNLIRIAYYELNEIEQILEELL